MKKLLILFFSAFFLYALNLPLYFRADFIQKMQNVTYKGKIFLYKDRVLWEYNYPVIKKVLITDKMYICEPDLEQVIVSKKPDFNLFKILKKVKRDGKYYIADVKGKRFYFIYDKALQKIWYKNDLGEKVNIIFFNQSLDKFSLNVFNISCDGYDFVFY